MTVPWKSLAVIGQAIARIYLNRTDPKRKIAALREKKAAVYEKLYQARNNAIQNPLEPKFARLARRYDNKLRKLHKRIEELEKRI